MSISAFLLSWIVEDPLKLSSSAYFETRNHSAATVLLIFISAVLAFLMVVSEFTVIKETSALTFMVAGTCKELLTGEAQDSRPTVGGSLVRVLLHRQVNAMAVSSLWISKLMHSSFD